MTGLKSFRFSSLGRAARVGDAAKSTHQPDDTADERHVLQRSAAAHVTSAAAEETAAPDGGVAGSAGHDPDPDSGRKRKAEGQSVLSPAPMGLLPAPATAVLIKRRASPTLPAPESVDGWGGRVDAVTASPEPMPAARAEHDHEADAAPRQQHSSGTAMAPACEDDEDDDDNTVLPGNSRLAARVLAGRQSLAPSRAQVSAPVSDEVQSDLLPSQAALGTLLILTHKHAGSGRKQHSLCGPAYRFRHDACITAKHTARQRAWVSGQHGAAGCRGSRRSCAAG